MRDCGTLLAEWTRPVGLTQRHETCSKMLPCQLSCEEVHLPSELRAVRQLSSVRGREDLFGLCAATEGKGIAVLHAQNERVTHKYHSFRNHGVLGAKGSLMLLTRPHARRH